MEDDLNLYQLAFKAHEKEFGCEPVHWGLHACNDESAKRIFAAIVKGVPYDETPEGFDPDNSIIG
jgi:hypothetical protein